MYAKRNSLLLTAVFVLIVSFAACVTSPNPTVEAPVEPLPAQPGSPVVPLLTDQQVTTVVENMLTGYNNGDYAAFTRDLSSQYKLVINEAAFQNFVAQSKATLGQFKSLTSIQQDASDSTGSTWVITAEFENQTVQFMLIFDPATGQIVGMDFGPVGYPQPAS